MIISFAWTSPALIAGRKTVTRRDWTPEHAAKFRAGDTVQAYDANPRNGGKRIALIRLTADPYVERSNETPPEDYAREGFAYLLDNGHTDKGVTALDIWIDWHRNPVDQYVVRFEVITLEEQES